MIIMDTRIIIRRKDRVEFILSGICDYYNIDKDDLLRSRSKGVRCKRKAISVKLLRDVADISLKEIGYLFHCKDTGGVWRIYQEVQEDREYNNIIKHLGL